METLEQFIGRRFPEAAVKAICYSLRKIALEVSEAEDPDGALQYNLTANFGLSEGDAEQAIAILMAECQEVP